MTFIIKKKSTRNGKVQMLHYLVENYRVGLRVKRRTLLTLHKHNNLSDYLKETEKEESKQLNRLNLLDCDLNELINSGKLPRLSFQHPNLVKRNLIKHVERAKTKLREIRDKKGEIRNFM